MAQRIVTDSTGYSKKFLTPYNGVRALCQSERLNFLEKVDYNIFLHLFDIDSFLIWVFRKFLWIHLGTAGEVATPPSLRPLHLPPSLAPAFTLPLPLLAWGQIFYRSYAAFRPPRTQTPSTSVQGNPKSPSRSPSLSLRSPVLLAPPHSKVVGRSSS